MITLPIVLDIRKLVNNVMKQTYEPIKYESLLKSIGISLVTAIFAYLLLFLHTNYVTLYFAYDFDIPAYMNLQGVHLLSDTNSWQRDALITILLSKPISAILAGIIFLIILMIGTKKPVSIILLLFWINVFAFNMAFGLIIDDAIAHSGTYKVALEMNIIQVSLIAISILLTYFLYKIGMMNGRLIIMSFPHQNLCFLKNRIIFFITIFFLPWLAVLFYTYLSGGASVPISEVLKNLPVLVLLIPFLTSEKIKNIEFKYLPTIYHTKIDLILSILFVISSIVLIFVINNGIRISG